MTDAGPCPSCGYRNPLGANFCASCGHALVAPSDDRTESIEATDDSPEELPPGIGMLIVRQGAKRGSRMALDAEVVKIGRDPGSDIFLDDITVSRRHAEIERTAEGHVVRDVGSLNGTYVNKKLVEQGVLTDGDELQVGKFKLVYVALGTEGDGQ